MKALLRFCLMFAALFEIVITLAILFMPPPNPGSAPPDTIAAVKSLAPWALPMGTLAVLAIAVFIVVGRQWSRMALFEKSLVVVPAVAPLILLRFLFSVAIALIVGCLVVVAIIALLAVTAGAGGFGGSRTATKPRGFGGTVYDKYGNRFGSVDGNTGIAYDRYGNRVGSVDGSGNIRDQYGNNVGSIE